MMRWCFFCEQPNDGSMCLPKLDDFLEGNEFVLQMSAMPGGRCCSAGCGLGVSTRHPETSRDIPRHPETSKETADLNGTSPLNRQAWIDILSRKVIVTSQWGREKVWFVGNSWRVLSQAYVWLGTCTNLRWSFFVFQSGFLAFVVFLAFVAFVAFVTFVWSAS